MFTVEQRIALEDRVLQVAAADSRVVAGAVVGSLATGDGDRFSDLDLTFAVADQVPVGQVLDDWTGRLADELGAIRLADLERGPTVYRVLLFPDALQLDLSLTPAAAFRPAGPRFRLVCGAIAEGPPEVSAAVGTLFIPVAAVPEDVFGWGVIYALHARACTERGRGWQAEHYVTAVRDHALSLACLNHGLPAAQARRFDDLPAAVLDRLAGSHVAALEPAVLRAALAASVRALIHEARHARLRHADVVAARLADLALADLA